MLMGLSLLSQPAQALNITYSFDGSDNGLSTITKTDSGSGVVLTLSNPNANGGNFIADGQGLGLGLGTSNSFGQGISQFSLSFSQSVTLNSYVIGDGGGNSMNPFSISTSTNNPLSPAGNYSFNNPFTLTANQDYTLSTVLPGSVDYSQIKSITVDYATPVPWETDALPVIGSTIFFAGGLWAKRKFAKHLQK